jgi:hypothetical protein
MLIVVCHLVKKIEGRKIDLNFEINFTNYEE